MAKAKAISDEQIIAALLSSGTIKEAAAAVGLSERAVYDRMNGDGFSALYCSAKADVMRAAVVGINEHIHEAIDTIADIMHDRSNNPAIRLQAAQTLLNNAVKFSERLTSAEAVTSSHIFCDKMNGLYTAAETEEI